MEICTWIVIILIFIVFYLAGCYRVDCCVDAIKHGTVTQSYMEKIQRGLNGEVTSLFDDAVMTVPPSPANTSDRTISELRRLQRDCHRATADERALVVLTSANGWMSDIHNLLGDRVIPPDVVDAAKKAERVVSLFKIHYDRPRPCQLGGAVGIPVYPLVADGGTAGYVSRNVTLSRLYAVLLSRVYPDLTDRLFAVSKRVLHGRLISGCNYESDCTGAVILADFIAGKSQVKNTNDVVN